LRLGSVTAPPSAIPWRPRAAASDLLVLGLGAAIIAGILAFAREFDAPYAPVASISLAPSALPRYVAHSLARGVVALGFSYVFALAFGWTTARWRAAERLMLPAIDVLQSVPALGFLPGLVLGLVALFPARNTGLELAAILMIFTAQARTAPSTSRSSRPNRCTRRWWSGAATPSCSTVTHRPAG
jgi:hypothetical protein